MTITLRKNARHFIGGLSIALIVIAMVCAFILVDLNSERYMPGLLDPIYTITEIGPDGITFYWMGTTYRIEAVRAAQLGAKIWDFRAFIPPGVRLAGRLATIAAY